MKCYKHQIKSFLQKYRDDIFKQYALVDYDSLPYIQAFYGSQIKIKYFLYDYRDYIAQQYADLSKSITYEHLFKNFPFLGNFTSRHSFHLPPLYRYLNPTEPQFTKALSGFLYENQSSCKAFLQAIFTLLKEDIELPEKGYQCLCEVITKDVDSKHKQRKRIDNVIIWNNHALCIEVKFDAVIDSNDLDAYEKQMHTTAKDKSLTYVAISIDDIQATINKKGCNKWKNLRWYDVMRLWEQIIYQNNLEESSDMTRYRSSLWNKILYWEH